MNTKVADKKGRVALGSQYAGKTFIIKASEDRLILDFAVVVPGREAWLYKNKKALQAVQRGLDQAAAGEFSESPPDLDVDAKLVEKIDD